MYVGVRDGGGTPLVLAHLCADDGRQRDRYLRRDIGETITYRNLVVRISVSMQQANPNGLNVLLFEFRDDLVDWAEIEFLQDVTRGIDTFFDLRPDRPFREWRRHFDGEVEEVVAPLAPDFQNVPEPFGCDQAGLDAFAFDQGVCHQGGAVDDCFDIARRNTGVRQYPLDPVDDRARRIVRRGQKFCLARFSARDTPQNDIREGAANVDPDAILR